MAEPEKNQTTCYVVSVEYQADTASVEAVYLSKRAAEKHARELRREYHRDGHTVYNYSEEHKPYRDETEWDITINVDEAILSFEMIP